MLKRITIHVKPGSKKGPLVVQGDDGEYTIYVREHTIEGAANEAAIELLAAHFHVSKIAL